MIDGTGRIEIRLFGGVTAWRDSAELTLGGANPRRCLAALALAAPHPLSQERLATCIWGSDPPPTAGRSSQVLLSRLRTSLGAGAIRRAQTGAYQLAIDPMSIDAHCLRSALTAAHAEDDPDTALAALSAALERCRAEPLAGIVATAPLNGECRPPAAWDHLEVSSASVMGPPVRQ